MKLHRLAVVGLASAATLLVATVAGAAAAPRGFHPPSDSLRSLAAPIGLRVGNAVNMDKLNVNAEVHRDRRRPVQHGHPRERDEVGHHRTEPGLV